MAQPLRRKVQCHSLGRPEALRSAWPASPCRNCEGLQGQVLNAVLHRAYSFIPTSNKKPHQNLSLSTHQSRRGGFHCDGRRRYAGMFHGRRDRERFGRRTNRCICGGSSVRGVSAAGERAMRCVSSVAVAAAAAAAVADAVAAAVAAAANTVVPVGDRYRINIGPTGAAGLRDTVAV